MFLSIHLNAEDTGSWRGAQVFYDDTNEENETIAQIFQKQFQQDLNTNREYKKVDELYLQKRVTRPGVLLEVGFLSNTSDRYLLKQDNYQDKIVNSISQALINYFKTK